jgi:hypothetical protein
MILWILLLKVLREIMMCNNLLQEETGFKTSVMYEDAFDLTGKKVKRLKVEGTAIVADIPGINGRSYPLRILQEEVNRFNEKFVSVGRAAAELNHPRLTKEGEGKDYSVFEMNLMKTCALIETLRFDGKNLYCKMVIVEDHPAGQAIASLIKAGYVPGYSLRGAGSVVDTGMGFFEVADDYRLITIDIVGNPSFDDKALIKPKYEAIQSTPSSILMESVNIATQEILYNRDVKVGFKKYDTIALESSLNAIKLKGLI